MRKNTTKQKIIDGQTVLGVFQAFDSPDLTEMFGYAGFDFIVFDTEHGNLYPGQCENLIRAAELSDITPILRIPSYERSDILKALDRGAMGLLIPMVNTQEEVENIISLAKYSPIGNRGLAFSTRAAKYGMAVEKQEHLTTSNSEILVIVQAETKEAVNNLDKILQVDALDGVFIGPADLSQSFGVPGDVNNIEVKKVIEESIQKIRAAKKIAGIFTGSVQEAQKWAELGANFVACGAPGILGKAMKNYVTEFKKKI